MSPASQGGVEVERYIGSCLISSSLRSAPHKAIVAKKDPVSRGKTRGCYTGQGFANEQVQYGPGGWAGAPLISMTSSPRRCNQRSSPSLLQQQQQQQQQPQQQQQQQQVCDQQQVSTHLPKNPLSRLAIHTQGAPLILTGRFHNRGKLHNSGGNVNGIGNAACSGVSVNSYVHGNGNGATNGTMNSAVKCPSRSQRPDLLPKKPQGSPKPDCSGKESSSSIGSTGTSNNIANIDSLSIASDESSGSNNSENSLPRIIKPRKRRKKDRKPTTNNAVAVGEIAKHEEQQQQQQQQQSGGSVASDSTVVPLNPYTAGCYEAAPQLRNHRRPPIARESVYAGCRAQTSSMSEIADARQRYAHRHVEVKVLDDNRNVVVPVQIRTVPKGGGGGGGYRHNTHHHVVPRYLHEYNLVGCEDGIKDGLGSCQCTYRDPSGLIWDVDQNCYSPFFPPTTTTEFCSNHHFSHVPLFLSRPALNCQGHSVEKLLNDHQLAHQEKDNTGPSGVVLRRSWSDPSSYFTEEIAAPSKDVGVIGDRGQTESGKRRTLWRGDSIGIPTNGVGSSGPGVVNDTISSPKGLEVSTEIITSPNGHRDLEIKFYSASPNAPATGEDKLVFAEEVDDDEEDFSDIWSYHESKLQQDFRTLLQAEE